MCPPLTFNMSSAHAQTDTSQLPKSSKKHPVWGPLNIRATENRLGTGSENYKDTKRFLTTDNPASGITKTEESVKFAV